MAEYLHLHAEDCLVEATVHTRGAALGSLAIGGVSIVEQRPADDLYAAGDVLFPWPNRLEDGQYTWEGVSHQLAIDEPDRRNAVHGLVRSRDFQVLQRDPDAVELGTLIEQVPGYPFVVELTIRYALRRDGMDMQFRARNLGTSAAPVALGLHPYLRIGAFSTHDLVLDIDAEGVLRLDERLLPTEVRPVARTEVDPSGFNLAEAELNHCYELRRPSPDGYRHRLWAPDGRRIEVWADACFPWVQVYTCPTFPGLDGTRTAVAVEPMTAPPNALRTGRDLIRLLPGADWDASCSIRLIDSP